MLPRKETIVEHTQYSSLGPVQVNDDLHIVTAMEKHQNDYNCCSGQWFYYRCVNIKKAPHGKWFCKEYCASKV